jgi:hypothetical protein
MDKRQHWCSWQHQLHTGPLLVAAILVSGLWYSCDADEGYCGDGKVDPGEECDYGPNPFFSPYCYCGSDCNWVGANCDNSICGDGRITGVAQCDDGELNSDVEPNACRQDCLLPWCGDGVLDDAHSESCDGVILGGQTCSGLGYTTGTLGCSTGCAFDTSGCSPDLCGNGSCGPGETTANCSADCPTDTCGDCTCGPEENPDSCPTDCSYYSCIDQSCPGTQTCYDTMCVTGLPACMGLQDPFQTWSNDSDLEPNGTHNQAVTLPCLDDGVAMDPEYSQRCPSRQSYTNGFMNLVICPAGERDFYGLYLLAGESVSLNLRYRIDVPTQQLDLDLTLWRWDDSAGQLAQEATATSSTDNETLSITASAQGWYYADVHGKCQADINDYAISFTLNPSP